MLDTATPLLHHRALTRLDERIGQKLLSSDWRQ
jgi:hypothetical protein